MGMVKRLLEAVGWPRQFSETCCGWTVIQKADYLLDKYSYTTLCFPLGLEDRLSFVFIYATAVCASYIVFDS